MGTEPRPNIVFILCDNVGWGDFGVYGGGTATPRIDQLAGEGVRFNNYTVEVVCCDCGDHPYWDYSEISLSPQRIRGPYTTTAAVLAAYDQHLGLATGGRRS